MALVSSYVIAWFASFVSFFILIYIFLHDSLKNDTKAALIMASFCIIVNLITCPFGTVGSFIGLLANVFLIWKLLNIEEIIWAFIFSLVQEAIVLGILMQVAR